MNAPLQNSLQAATAKVSKAQRVAAAVCAVIDRDPAQYEHPLDLYHYVSIQPLVKDANDLSITLSDAYKQGLVGRVHAPRGREKFAYGPPGPRADGVRVVRSQTPPPPRKVVGYRLRLNFTEPDLALQELAGRPGTVSLTDEGWCVTRSFASAEELLQALIPYFDGDIEEVTE